MTDVSEVERFVVDEVEHAMRLDRLLTRRLPNHSRTELQGWIRAGRVLLDEEVVTKGGTPVAVGQHVQVTHPEPVELVIPETGSELRILYEDAALFVIDKPAGMASHRNGNCPSGTVADLALARYGELPCQQGEDRPGIVHRLDRDTSGVMVLAKTDPAMESLRAQFKARTVQKEYRALVHGVPTFDSQWIDRPIGRDPARPDRLTIVPSGREAQTYYEVLERYRGFAYVRCRPRTGRTHQIRVHMQSEGFPLVGDKVYRTRSSDGVKLPEDAPDVTRQCLHAYMLAFSHPLSQEPLEFTIQLPDDMRAFRDYCREYMAVE